jgi:hypothetical protein
MMQVEFWVWESHPKLLFSDMPKIQKQKLLAILIFVCLLMAILSISLSMLQMQPGKFFLPQFSNQSTEGSNQELADLSWVLILIRGLQILLIILLPIYLIVGMLSKRGRRNLWIDLLKIIIPFLIIMWISEVSNQLPRDEERGGLPPGFPDFSDLSRNSTILPGFEANPQSWMLILTIISVAGLVAAITFFGLRSLSKRDSTDDDEFQELASRAQAALDDIEADRIEFDDVIIRCYAEMSQALQVEKGIKRKQAVTSHEFEKELLSKGFPAHPVQQLTKLFEQVRYGRQKLGEDAKGRAMESLREIIAFCKGAA